MLGIGMVGRAMALDMLGRHEVLACDRSPEALAGLVGESERRGLTRPQTRVLDAADREGVREAVRGCDLAVIAVPGFLGYRVLATVIDVGTDAVDISFCPEDTLALDTLARERGTSAVVDIGVAPGLASMLLGRLDRDWRVTDFECLVGGLPESPVGPWHYKAPFSPADVVEEYLRPSRSMEGGELVVKPALSDPELIEFPAVGTLEAFNTDGLRSILTSMRHVPNMRERTLRWPGHRDRVLALRDAGLLSNEPVTVADAAGRPVHVVPREVTCGLLFPQWTLEPGETEFTVMRVVVRGTDRGTGEPRAALFELLDRTDPVTGTTSMARTTGYTCTALAELVLSGVFREPGVHPGERVGAVPGVLDAVLDHLAERGIHVEMSGDPIP